MRDVNKSVERYLRDFPTLFRYPEPLKSKRQCPKCKAKVVRIADRQYGNNWEETLFRCFQCDNLYLDNYKVRPFRIPCPDCGSDKNIRRKRRMVVDGRVVSLFQCQECGRYFRDYYRKVRRANGNTTRWRGSLLRGVICPECKQDYHIVLFGKKKGKRQQYQCRNCGRTFTENTETKDKKKKVNGIF